MSEPTCNATTRLAADLVVRGGTILTLDRRGSRASALAARDGRITAIGDDDAIAGLIGSATTVMDLDGRSPQPKQA